MRKIAIAFSMLLAGSGIVGALDIVYPPLASLISGKVAVSNGGTGNTTNTQNGILFGNGTSAIGATRQCAATEVLMGNGAAPPVCQSGPAVSSMTTTGQAVILGTATISGTAFSVGGSNLAVTSGGVGIGTNAPGTTLDVNGGATVRGQSTFVSSATFRNTNPSLEVGVLSVANAVIDSPESLEAFIDATNVYTTSAFRWGKGSNAFGAGTELMRLQENGNLGIGLTAPGTLLDVNGGATVRGQETVTSSVTVLGTGNSVYSLTTSSGINVQAGGIALAAGGFINLNGSVYTNPDYVFDPNYGQMSLAELRDYVAENRHLPNVPSTAEVKAHGVEIFGQNRSVLENLENAYLYIFKLNDKLERQSREIEKLKSRLGE